MKGLQLQEGGSAVKCSVSPREAGFEKEGALVWIK